MLHDDDPVTTAAADPATYVWHDPIVYRRLHEESAAAWLGTIDFLRESEAVDESLLDEAEALVASAEALDPDVFSATWVHPLCFGWSFALYEAAEQRNEPRLAQALHRMHLVAAASALARGDGVEFRHPVPLAKHAVLPGLPAVLEVEPGGLLAGVAGHELLLVRGDQHARLDSRKAGTALGVTLRPRHRVGVGRLAVDLLPEAFFGAETGMGDSADALGDAAFHALHAPLVNDAFALVQQHQASTFDQMVQHLRVVGLKDFDTGEYTNVSVSEAPGAFVASVYEHPYEMADIFIHEMHHNRLFALENVEPLLDLGDPWLGYSPWRNDPRPLRGLLHAVYVFLPVARYWDAVLGAGGLDDDLTAYARDQVVRTALQLRTAFTTLDTNAGWTAHGSIVRPVLEAGVIASEARAEMHELSRATPAWRIDKTGRLTHDPEGTVGASVDAHRARYEATYGVR
ncbi:MAG: HEXXH motif-containing putative peptide modification protein [Planctomycetota bacterium]